MPEVNVGDEVTFTDPQTGAPKQGKVQSVGQDDVTVSGQTVPKTAVSKSFMSSMFKNASKGGFEEVFVNAAIYSIGKRLWKKQPFMSKKNAQFVIADTFNVLIGNDLLENYVPSMFTRNAYGPDWFSVDDITNMLKKVPQQVVAMGIVSWFQKTGFTGGMWMNIVDCALTYTLANVVQRKVLPQISMNYSTKYI